MYTKNVIFAVSVIIANSIRDLAIMLIEISLNITLIVILKKYTKKRNESIQNSDGSVRIKNTGRKNAVIALILCSVSALVHCFAFSVKIYFSTFILIIKLKFVQKLSGIYIWKVYQRYQYDYRS